MSVAVLAVVSTTLVIEERFLENLIRQSVTQTLATSSFPLTPSKIKLDILDGSPALLKGKDGVVTDIACRVSGPLRFSQADKDAIEQQLRSYFASCNVPNVRIVLDCDIVSVAEAASQLYARRSFNELEPDQIKQGLDILHRDVTHALGGHA